MFNKRLIQYVPDAMKSIRFNVLFQWLGMLCSVGCTLLITWFAAAAIAGTAVPSWLLILAGLILLSALRALFVRLASDQALKSSHIVKTQMRKALFDKAAQIGPGYVEYFPSSEMSQLASEGTEQLESYFASYLPQFFYALIAPVTLFLIVVFWDWKAALALLVCVPLIPASIVAVQKFAKKLLAKYWGQYAGLSDSFLENLQGLTTLKIYNADGRRHEQMNEEAENFRRITMRVLIMQLNSISVMDLVAYGGSALGIALALIAFQNGTCDLFQTLSIILLSAEFFLPMRLLGSYFHVSMNGSAAADRMFRILDIQIPERPLEFPAGTPKIAAENLSFRYLEGRLALDEVSFELPDHGFVGICGESGSGKSTLAALLSGRLQDASGALTISQVPAGQIQVSELEKEITSLGFESTLFAGTVRDNLKMASENASDEEMMDVLEKAGIWKDLQAMNGLDTQIAEQASSLSGGQRQRIAFARALLKNSPILILDEATSSVDADTEKDMMSQIHAIAEDRLVLCISHRLANIQEAEKILVLKDGRLAESGTHSELLKDNGEYARMYSVQQDLEKYAGSGSETQTEKETEKGDRK